MAITTKQTSTQPLNFTDRLRSTCTNNINYGFAFHTFTSNISSGHQKLCWIWIFLSTLKRYYYFLFGCGSVERFSARFLKFVPFFYDCVAFVRFYQCGCCCVSHTIHYAFYWFLICTLPDLLYSLRLPITISHFPQVKRVYPLACSRDIFYGLIKSLEEHISFYWSPIIYSFNSLIRFDLTQFIINDMWFRNQFDYFGSRSPGKTVWQRTKERQREKKSDWFGLNNGNDNDDENDNGTTEIESLALRRFLWRPYKRNAFAHMNWLDRILMCFSK